MWGNSDRPRAPGALDFASAWRTWLESAGDPRLDPSVDLAYWKQVADAHENPSGKCARTLAKVRSMVRPEDSVLDVGAGAGRFALPLSAACAHMTAVDQSPDMLAVLEQKARAAGLTNISLRCSAWEELTVDRHDVVLSAWSLYRQLDLTCALQRMLDATRRLLVIVAPDADASQRERGETAAYLYVLGVLRELGARAELTFVDEPQPGGAEVPVPVITWTRAVRTTDALGTSAHKCFRGPTIDEVSL